MTSTTTPDSFVSLSFLATLFSAMLALPAGARAEPPNGPPDDPKTIRALEDRGAMLRFGGDKTLWEVIFHGGGPSSSDPFGSPGSTGRRARQSQRRRYETLERPSPSADHFHPGIEDHRFRAGRAWRATSACGELELDDAPITDDGLVHLEKLSHSAASFRWPARWFVAPAWPGCGRSRRWAPFAR